MVDLRRAAHRRQHRGNTVTLATCFCDNIRMAMAVEQLGLYLHLARAAELRRQPLVRDRLLVLAGALAGGAAGLPPIAECCRERILRSNPGHMVGRWPTMIQALAEPDVANLVGQLLRRYGPEQAEQLLTQLGIERGDERAAYFSDGEYAAALLGERWDELVRRYGSESTG